ncbi:Casbene synthase, chloroplast precursor, putative [Ricinus communis]|uniref:Probable terpene synthase 6 n=1 Tax=Ricinus communis TaxID=3988 RepID=TPS6_RICCO|nr:RecName: Full=Probable terpene synthase 6; Short=RcSeTPS6 [Ricinus communis]EEF48772.1 Casbene synthase, chloroplast precursor, putative [Ricinus communis]
MAEKDKYRPLANFPSTAWGCSFASFSSSNSDFELYTREVETLKEKVRPMVTASTKDPLENVQIINLLYRLGVSYHFENEITDQLNHIFEIIPNHIISDDNDYDLYTVAILFQILRQYGHKVPCDVFNKFKNSDGKFKKSIANDLKGLLSLYEASFLSVHGENILDEAIAFTRPLLESFADQSSPHLAKYIRNSLLRPHHQGIQRVEARQYISFYEEDESRNETLLKFAKLDFNRLQLLHKQELASLSRYKKYIAQIIIWEDLNLAKELPYIRDRLVETYLWAIGAHFEPQYALSRAIIAKYTTIVSAVDDTYDAYGTLDELQRFTNAFQRCDIDAIDELPDYMKVLYRALLNFFDQIEDEVDEGRSYSTSVAKEAFKELVRSYYVEAQWFSDGYVPSFDEYMRNGLITSTYTVLPAASFIGMENTVGEKEYKWVQSNPKIVKAAKIICRLMDDITTHEDEQKRGHCASSIECYMKEYGVSEKKAIEEIQKICANAWKDMNEECMKKPPTVSRTLLKYYVNLARVIDFVYKNLDSYTYASSLKGDITTVFLELLPV